MSTFGMGIAGSVAQSGVQSQQVARAQHRERTDTSAEAKKVREQLSAHFEAIEEGDEANFSQVHIDEQMGEREHPQDDREEAAPKPQAVVEALDPDVAAPLAGEQKVENDPAKLYKHIDMTA